MVLGNGRHDEISQSCNKPHPHLITLPCIKGVRVHIAGICGIRITV